VTNESEDDLSTLLDNYRDAVQENARAFNHLGDVAVSREADARAAVDYEIACLRREAQRLLTTPVRDRWGKTGAIISAGPPLVVECSSCGAPASERCRDGCPGSDKPGWPAGKDQCGDPYPKAVDICAYCQQPAGSAACQRAHP